MVISLFIAYNVGLSVVTVVIRQVTSQIGPLLFFFFLNEQAPSFLLVSFGLALILNKVKNKSSNQFEYVCDIFNPITRIILCCPIVNLIPSQTTVLSHMDSLEETYMFLSLIYHFLFCSGEGIDQTSKMTKKNQRGKQMNIWCLVQIYLHLK